VRKRGAEQPDPSGRQFGRYGEFEGGDGEQGGGEGLVAAQHDDRAGDERETVRGVTDLA
jgi:hypothetical protein